MGEWMAKRFPYKVQKLSVDAGFTCPNRDGRLSTGGCIFCDNRTFNPKYCHPGLTVTQQIAAGKSFYAGKYPHMKYLVYFQAFSNTYAPLHRLQEVYEEALETEDVAGIVIGTRPDCINEDILDYLEMLNRHAFVMVEYGIESTLDQTLNAINRHHTFDCSRKAIEATHARHIATGGHLIIGLPGEDKQTILDQAHTVSQLPLDVLKLHQLQIIRGTELERRYHAEPFPLMTLDEYVAFIAEYIRRLRPSLAIDRFVSQSPRHLLVAPRWGIKSQDFAQLLTTYMLKRGYFQGQTAITAADGQ